jgi:hypothetical protein
MIQSRLIISLHAFGAVDVTSINVDIITFQ